MAQDKKTISAGGGSASGRNEVKAFARFVHVSPRKLRLVADLVRTSPVDVALEQLRFSSKNAALPLIKAINSAVANAVHNFDWKRETLYIKAVTIDGGPVFKTFAPRAQGRAFEQRQRPSHINVVLGSRPGQTARKRSVFQFMSKSQSSEPKVVTNEPEAGQTSTKHASPKQAPRAAETRKQNIVSLKRRLFNRKSGE